MKMKLMAAAALCCMMTAFTSCSVDDNPVAPVCGRAMITVNTAALYDELENTDLVSTDLDDGKISLVDTVLIYDQTGNLVIKLGAKSSTLQPITFDSEDLFNGTYTLVVWQTAVNNQYDVLPWYISGEEQLSTVNLTTPYENIGGAFALGYAAATVAINNGFTNVDLQPKSLGSVVDVHVDNFTEDTGYSRLALTGGNSQYVFGCKLDPSLPEEDRWIKGSDKSETICYIATGDTGRKVFTLTHGDNVKYVLWGLKNNKWEWIIESYYNLGTGDKTAYYFDMKRRSWQPPFFGTPEDFEAWKADRDEGILVVDPCLDWGCSIDDVEQHVKAKQWWAYGNDKLEIWEAWGMWHKWYYVASSLTEQYLFKTEDGQNLNVVLSICHDSSVPLDVAHNSLLKQGYTCAGKVVFPGYAPRDIYFSADGKTEVQTILYGDGRWEIFYQPTDPDDFQYIVPADE